MRGRWWLWWWQWCWLQLNLQINIIKQTYEIIDAALLQGNISANLSLIELREGNCACTTWWWEQIYLSKIMSVSSVASFHKNVRHYFLNSWSKNCSVTTDLQNIDYKGLWNVFFTNNFQAVGFLKLFHTCSFHTNFNLIGEMFADWKNWTSASGRQWQFTYRGSIL